MLGSPLGGLLAKLGAGEMADKPKATEGEGINKVALPIPDQRQPSRSPSKARSLSDGGGPPALSPSPKFREPEKKKSKDDSAIYDSPVTPRRPAFPARGLSLQMPPRDFMLPSTSAYHNKVPLSPKLDHSQTYGSPTSLLPRRSRGLDYSRAATNLHHSTLAESSPDSSPTISGRGINIPNRSNGAHFVGSSDQQNNNSLWSTMAHADRMVSGSLGSVNMMGSDSSDSDSDMDDPMDADDIDESILTTPQVSKMGAPFGASNHPSPGNGWMSQSPAVNSLMNFQRARLHHGKSRRSLSNSSSRSMASPTSRSPPSFRNMEGMSYNREMPLDGVSNPRRESISWAANQLHISGSESDENSLKSTLDNVDGVPITPGRDGQRGVIRRPVTRRGNMLPKTKTFARIRAALAEESAPVETEVRREAEVVRQTRESGDMDLEISRHPIMSGTTTTNSSPNLGPLTQGLPEDHIMGDISSAMSNSFKQHAINNSKGKDFWDTFSDDTNQTPPPGFLPRGSSSGMSEDLSMDTSTPPSTFAVPANISDRTSSPSRSGTPQPTAAEITRKVNNKRRRDDDFDPSSFKRRAVSPGMSVQNSPVMQSPMQRETALWGSRPSSNGDGKQASNGGPLKRVGLEAMERLESKYHKLDL